MPYVGQTALEHELDDVKEVIRMIGRSIEEGKADKGAVLDNLFIAMQKIENIKASLRKK